MIEMPKSVDVIFCEFQKNIGIMFSGVKEVVRVLELTSTKLSLLAERGSKGSTSSPLAEKRSPLAEATLFKVTDFKSMV
jgi:hypothetical protein